jgi:hypothetical protein
MQVKNHGYAGNRRLSPAGSNATPDYPALPPNRLAERRLEQMLLLTLSFALPAGAEMPTQPVAPPETLIAAACGESMPLSGSSYPAKTHLSNTNCQSSDRKLTWNSELSRMNLLCISTRYSRFEAIGTSRHQPTDK